MGGISFIGAGVILRDTEARRVEGLTTAATVWITAALGIACGLAAWTTVGLPLSSPSRFWSQAHGWKNCSRVVDLAPLRSALYIGRWCVVMHKPQRGANKKFDCFKW